MQSEDDKMILKFTGFQKSTPSRCLSSSSPSSQLKTWNHRKITYTASTLKNYYLRLETVYRLYPTYTLITAARLSLVN